MYKEGRFYTSRVDCVQGGTNIFKKVPIYNIEGELFTRRDKYEEEGTNIGRRFIQEGGTMVYKEGPIYVYNEWTNVCI